MAGKIPQAFIDEVLQRIDIVDLIDRRIPLKKAGRNFTACCPFHTEKTPSFTVSPDKQFYHCFGCGAHGTAIGFLMEYEHQGFVEAVGELAGEVGLSLPQDSGTTPDAGLGDLYDVMQAAAQYYARQLRAHPAAQRAISYLKGRGLSGEIAAEYGLGFAPPGWDHLLSALGATPAQRRTLQRAGLIAEGKERSAYDRFRDRIIIPIHDRRGRVVALGGRALQDDGPKYLNSPETPIFQKGRELFGLHTARKQVRDSGLLLIVEGYMDVIALAQFDIRYAVATLGTATTADHLQTLFRIAPKILFCFDGDRAGRSAAWRALEQTLPTLNDGREAAFLFLPEGEDPDSLVRREGRAAFEQRLQTALSTSEFLFQQLSSQVDLQTADGLARLASLAAPLINTAPDGVFKDLLLRRLARLTQLPDDQIARRVLTPAPATPRLPATGTSLRSSAQGARGGRTPVRLAVALLLQHPSLAGQVTNPQDLAGIDLPGMALFMELLEILHANPHLTTAGLLERWRDRPEGTHLFKLAQEELPGAAADLTTEFLDTLRFLQIRQREQRWQFLQHKLTQGGLTESEKTEWKQLLTVSQPESEQGFPDGKNNQTIVD